MNLKEYVVSNSVCNFKGFVDISGGIYSTELESLTTSIELVPTDKSQFVCPPIHLLKAGEFCHNELIDTIVSYMKEKKINNALAFDYQDGSEFNNVSSAWICAGVHSTTQLLKSPVFQLLRAITGDLNFILLLFNYSAIQTSSKVKIWGPISSPSYKRFGLRPGTLNINKMLYTENHTLYHLNPLPENSKMLLLAIFHDEINLTKDIPKRFRKLEKLLRISLANHSNKQEQYPYVFSQICPFVSKKYWKSMSNVDLQIDKKNVVKFIITVIEMVFPMEIIGSLKNKAILYSSVASLMNCSKSEIININDLVKGFKLNDIGWLKPQDNKTLTKAEFKRAQCMFKTYLHWFFGDFLLKLIGSFFHVTDISQSIKLAYYRHDTWAILTKRFKDKFYGKYLEELIATKNDPFKFSTNDEYIGKQKLLPKPKDFRFIVTPFKGRRCEKFEYMHFVRNELRPVSMILNSKRLKNSLSSVNQIFPVICDFKQLLQSIYDGSLPSIHALKFDVKQAYDSIPREKVLQVIDEILANDADDQEYVIQEFQSLSENNTLGRKKSIVLDSNNENAYNRIAIGTNIQRHKPIVLNKAELISVVRSQLYRTAVYSHYRTFVRKDGLFQGFPLSGTFCSLVYDKFVEYLLSLNPDHKELKIIRLADDFLILSTDMELIKNYRKLISRTITEFNITINRKKTLISSDEVEFIGVTINLPKLAVYKKAEMHDLTPVILTSFNGLYSRLNTLINLRLENYCCSPAYNDEETLKINVVNFIRSIILKFLNSYPFYKGKDVFDKDQMKKFLRVFKLKLFRRLRFVEWATDSMFECVVLKEFNKKCISI